MAPVTYTTSQKFHSFDETQPTQIDPSTGEFQLDCYMVLYGMSRVCFELVHYQNLTHRFAWLDLYRRTFQVLTIYQSEDNIFEQVDHHHKVAYLRDQHFYVWVIKEMSCFIFFSHIKIILKKADPKLYSEMLLLFWWGEFVCPGTVDKIKIYRSNV